MPIRPGYCENGMLMQVRSTFTVALVKCHHALWFVNSCCGYQLPTKVFILLSLMGGAQKDFLF